MACHVFNAQAQEGAGSFVAPLVNESLLLDVSTGNNTIVVGERGHILVSSSDTTNFTQVDVPVRTTLTAVAAINDFAWAVGHDATILRSKNAGKTWEISQQAPELDRPLLDIYFFDEKEGIAVGAYGLFYRSIDSGQNWTKETHPSVVSLEDKEYLDSIKDDEAFYLEELSFISPHFNRISQANDYVYLAGEAGLVARSPDRGKNWERLDLNYQGSFFDISMLKNGMTMAVGLRGNIYVYMNEQWKSVQSCVTTSLNAIVQGENDVYILGNNGMVLSVDMSNIESTQTQTANNEGCSAHVSVSQISTDFSDAVLNGFISGNDIVTVTAGGIKSVRVKK